MRTCKTCGATETRVLDSRLRFVGLPTEYVWRRRECLSCESRWTTHEIPAEVARAVARLETALEGRRE